MLKQRIITALVLLPVVLGVVLAAPLWLFDAVVAFALVLLALEFAALCSIGVMLRSLLVACVVVLYGLVVLPWKGGDLVANVVLFSALAAWLLAIAWLALRVRLPGPLKALAGVMLIAGAGIALHGLKMLSPDGRWVLAAFLIVWAADIGGYVAGRALGRHKLAPSISPGKTWEGFAGGVLLVLLLGALAAAWFVQPSPGWWLLLLLVAVMSVVGDLLESLLKRQAGVKDSGALLPGHGGLLDRLDSLLAVAPVFLFVGMEIGIFGGLSLFGR